MYFTWVKYTGGQSTIFFDKATRLIAGPRVLPLRSEPNFYRVSKFTNFKLFLILSCKRSVEMTGFEPVAFALQRRCSPAELHPRALPENSGGPDWTLTSDPSLIRTVL